MNTKKQLDQMMRDDNDILSPQDKLIIYLEENWKMMLGTILITGGLIFGIKYYKEQKQQTLFDASNRLAIASSAEGGNEVSALRDYVATEKQSSAKVQGTLLLAKELYHAGDYASALSAYDEAVNSAGYPTLQDLARMGKVYSLIALKKYDDAINVIDAMHSAGTSFPDYELTIQKARCKEALGSIAEARKLYEDLLHAGDPGPRRAYVEKKLTHLPEG